MRPRFLHVTLIAVVGFFAARIPLLPRRIFDPDELEHAHAAWLVYKGMVPYKDFFEHHTPWYYYVLRPFFNWFDVETSFESAWHFLVAGRGLSFLLTVLSIGLVFRIGRVWADRRVGLLAGLLLVSQPVFFQKTVEMRPDVPALLFFLCALWFLLRGLEDHRDSTAPDLRWFLAGGLGLGAAVMCTQKMLFVLPGALAGLAIWALSAGRAAARHRVLATAVFLAAICLPGVLTWAWFAAHHAGGEFITNNFLLNARWKSVATDSFLKLIWSSAPVLALSLLGGVLSARRFKKGGDALLICTVIGLFVGVLVVPSAHRQYYLMPLPIICLLAANGLVFLFERIQQRWRSSFVILATIGLAVLPVKALVKAFPERNDRQMAQLRTVFETTGPTDLVMDGWRGMGVFRPHAFYYYFLHREVRAMLPRPQLDAYLDALESGAIRPKLIAMDDNLRALGPRFTGFVEKNYASRDGVFYVLKGAPVENPRSQ